jgi:Flp pilus assembly protein TadD
MRKTLVIILCCLVVLLAGYVGYRGYKVWKQTHLMSLAQEFLARSDRQNALLCVQLVLRSNPQNIDAARMMANLNEAARSPGALLWRNRVVELNPASVEDKLALAQTAIIFHDYASATNALAAVSADGKKTVAYHNVAGTAAAVANQMADAEAHFLAAARLDPTNQVIQLNLAMVRLHGTNAPARPEARIALERISASSGSPDLRSRALRELVIDAAHYKQTATALTLSKELVEQTNSIFSDQLLRLDMLRAAQSAEFKPALVSAQREAANDAGKIYELATWQINTSPDDALAWLRNLPMNTQTNQPATLLIAQCLMLRQDWHGLSTWIEKQNWVELDFVRHAYLARALREQDFSAAGKTEWEEALKSANDQKTGLIMLLRLTAQWNWQSEGEDILWNIVNRYPGEQWANRALVQVLYAGGRTRPLMTLFNQQSKRDPSDLSIKNNLAMTALLLDAQELNPHELAREVFEKEPGNASYVSTYAFSLHMQKRDAEALKIIERLKPLELQNPSIAGYYGIILKATGNAAKARVYLDLATKSTLLPEEQKLFEQANAGT